MSQAESTRVFEGLKVLDLTRIVAGPLASQTLADFGARVIKVEKPPFGDEARSYTSNYVNDVHVSPMFTSLNTGKLSVGIDLSKPEGIEVLNRLVAEADVLIHNFRPDLVRGMSLDYESVSRINKRIVYCSISGFGGEGIPRGMIAGNDGILQAYGGLMSFSGEPGGQFVRCPVPVVDWITGLNCVIAIMGALASRAVSGRGSNIETSLLEGIAGLLSNQIGQYLLNGAIPGPMGSQAPLGQPNQVFATKDGHVLVATTSDDMFQRCCKILGASKISSDPRFADSPSRFRNRPALIESFGEVVSRFTSQEIIELLEGSLVLCSPINNIEQVVQSPQILALELVQSVGFGDIALSVVGPPARFDGARRQRTSVPIVGENTDEVLMELGYDVDEIDRLRKAEVVA